MTDGPEQRTAVIDLGSNSFRVVVFTSRDGWWKRTDEIYEPVRIGEGQKPGGPLKAAPTERALTTIALFAHFCRAMGLGPGDVDAVATSAIRSASNRDEFLERAHEASGLEIRVLSDEEEARYGYLAAVNSTSLHDGAVLDLGGGSLQLVRVAGRKPYELRSWPLGAVRMTERFLPDKEPPGKKALKALRAHVVEQLEDAEWLDSCGGWLVGLGGTIRNLAVAAQVQGDLPTFGVQGYALDAACLDDLVAMLASMPASERAKVPGVKAARGDIILAGAATIQAVLQAGGFKGVQVTEAGLREGVFFERHLAPGGLFDDVRAASVRNLAAQYDADPVHTQHVADLALGMFDELAAAGVHGGDASERELLRAAAMLHDIGTTVDYDDHHKHSRYLILNAGLPGFTQREIALIAQMARYHRKGTPSLDDLTALGRRGDRELLVRCSALLRLAEQLERPRDQLVRAAHLHVVNGTVELRVEGGGDVSLARWAVARQGDVFERAFARTLEVV